MCQSKYLQFWVVHSPSDIGKTIKELRIIEILLTGNDFDKLNESDHTLMTDLAANGTGLARYQAQELLCFFYDERDEFGIRPNTLIQESDSTFYGIVTVQRESDLQGGTVFYKLDKNGNLLFNTAFYSPEGTYRLSLIKRREFNKRK